MGAGGAGPAPHSCVVILQPADVFSLALLLKPLFNPFKQISAGGGGASFPAQFQAFLDRLFSRAVGATIRSLTILIGMVVISARAVWTLCSIALWTILPFVPLIGVALWLSGVTV